ncbi:oleosin 16 kDa [Cucumis sativus]|uniref:Oleosin n=1 Tax=Cucumis sativus TaxID=3659 RepID=A0A0A0LRY3_CUCSA|nr:oleosin 16 kDa [Cucumis sativus]
MSDQSKPVSARTLYNSTSSSRQAVKFLTAATIATFFLVSSGFTITGTVLILILSTPILVLFSPILVPAVTVLVLSAAGLFFSATCAVAAVAALSWLYSYMTGDQPVGAEQLDFARDKIVEMAKDMKEKATTQEQS